MAPSTPFAIIVGAGPSGLLLALLLAKRNIPSLILEASPVLDDSPRAAYYGPPASFELRRAGVLSEIRETGFSPEVTCWRKLDGTYLAGFNCIVDKDYEDRLACMPLAQLDQLLYRHVLKEGVERGLCEVRFGRKVLSVGQDEGSAWVEVEVVGEDRKEKLEAQYVVGCDGASSTVRRQLFGNGDFPGWTWDKQIVATNVRSSCQQRRFEAKAHRYHTGSINTAMRMSNSSSTPSTGTWSRDSLKRPTARDGGVSATARFRV